MWDMLFDHHNISKIFNAKYQTHIFSREVNNNLSICFFEFELLYHLLGLQTSLQFHTRMTVSALTKIYMDFLLNILQTISY